MIITRTGIAIFSLSLAACDGAGSEPACASLMAAARSPTSVDELEALVDGVRAGLYPELARAVIELRPLQSDGDFFNAFVDPTTLAALPIERLYLLRYNPALFQRKPPGAGVVAILAHELKHLVDYLGMDGQALIDFALEYATGEIAPYERATDEHVLRLGCADGLSAYRRWLYAQLDLETVAEKRRDYYTPEEIAAWIAREGG